MYCAKCGQWNEPNAQFCTYCGQTLVTGAMQAGTRPNLPNYLVWSILVTIFCCLPFGIVGIVYGAQVGGKLAAGDVAGAQYASDRARIWTLAGFWTGLALTVLGCFLGRFSNVNGIYHLHM